MPESIESGTERTVTAVYGCSPSADYPTTFITETVQTLLGHAPDEFLDDAQFRTHLIHPADAPRVLAALSRVSTQGPQLEEYRLRRKDQRYVWFRDEMQSAGAKQIVGCLTELVRDEPDMNPAEDEGQFQVLAESSSMMIWSSNLIGGFEYVSKGWLAFSGHAPEQERGKGWLELVHPEDRTPCVDVFGNAAKAGTAFELEFRLLRYDGQYRWVVIRGVPRTKPATSLYLGHVGYCIDITDYRRQADQLRTSLIEKGVLIREIHHRVKNNLQVVCSILSLQASSSNEPWTIKMFGEAERRVMTIALIHEQLDTSDNLAPLALGDYLRRVANHLLQCYREVGDVTVEVECDTMHLPLDIAQPCGLIVHELVSNSLKYAFPDQRPGKVSITVTRHEGDRVLMKVTDNGIGLPNDLRIEKTETLGLQLVRALVQQLDGSLTFSPAPATVEISFTYKGGLGHVRTANPDR